MSIRLRKVGEEKLKGDSKIESNSNWILHIIVDQRRTISLFVRLLSLASCSTYFVADEYWQSTEVAHWSVYGYGYLTWEWHEMIRAYIHPFAFEIYFRFVNIIGLDYTEILIYGPHVMQALLSVASDSALYTLTLNIFRSKHAAIFALVLHWFSWFVFYTSSRTLSNTAEMCFLTIGLSYFPFAHPNNELSGIDRSNSLLLAMLFGGVGCIIRCTSLVIWAPLLLSCIISRHISVGNFIATAIKLLPFLFLLSFGIDYYFYQGFVFVHFNFFKFNIFHNISAFYGSHAFHWYFTQGIPVVFSFHILFIAVGVYYGRRKLFWIAIIYVIIHSFIAHKEFRFLLPVSPMLICYAGYGVEKVSKLSTLWCKRMLTVILLSNTVLAFYFSLVHQRGTISVMAYLRESKEKTSLLFLMPCHSTPFYSHLHQNISLKFLACHPYEMDESDDFYKHPESWWKLNIDNNTRPSHIIAFNVLPQEYTEMLPALGYTKDASFFHTHFPEGRVGSYVDVYLDQVRKMYSG